MTKTSISRLMANRNSLWLGLSLFLVLVCLNWVGFIASDDVTYARGGAGWIEHFPFVGGHGTIRYPITIPIALSFLTFGENEFAMVLPSLIYMLICLAMIWHAVRNVAGTWSAACALALLITCPLLVIQSSIASIDIVEMAFLFASVLLFWVCLDKGPAPRILFASGAMAGLAFLARETAIFIVPFYGVLFLLGHRFSRRQYLWIVGGFLAVWGCEILYLWTMTGDPLYRINISLHHDSSIDRSVDLAGNAIVSPLIDPLLVLLFNQEFMALFFVAIPAAIWLCFGSGIDSRVRHFSRILALFGLCWFVCAAAAQKLLPLNPRYFMLTATVACTLTGIALAQFVRDKAGSRKWMAGMIALLLIGGNFTGIYVENKQNMFGVEQLVAVAASHPGEVITTDPMTRFRADILLQWAGAEKHVLSDPPWHVGLYFYNPAYADSANFKMDADTVALYQPQDNWTVLARYAPEPTYLAYFLEWTGLSKRLPEAVWYKLRYHHPEVMLYRIS